MKFIGDFHIHSHFSRATSKFLTPEHLDYWARLKGISVVGTGDCQHPGWYQELSKKLEPCPNGLYKLKSEYKLELPLEKNSSLHSKQVYFIPTTEISNIYKKNGKVRKVHNVCIFPNLEVVKWFQGKLELIGNIRSDGRPILGLDSKDLLHLTLESSISSIFIPAHIWTPWFSALGSKSGFDSIEECFEDLTPYIYAVETGLSSDPPMNRICSFLDRYNLVSNSDAHSPDKLGREANLFDTELTYNHIYEALKTGIGLKGTVEFYPQEGKYHYDGHRNCRVFWNPLETLTHGALCPICNQTVTKGVMYRVAELADRKNAIQIKNESFNSITPLPELLSEIAGVGPKSKRVQSDYLSTLSKLGSEFDILLNTEIEEIKSKNLPILAEGVSRLRNGEINISEGYDGVFGKINVFKKTNKTKPVKLNLKHKYSKKESVDFDVLEFQKIKQILTE
jgi:DNA helicase II / ATP-dependent DNA helicase PcrA